MLTTVTITQNHDNSNYKEHVVLSDQAMNAVLLDFNPSADPRVIAIKAMCAGVIQKMKDHQASPSTTDAQRRVAAYAITQMELTQMAAVKALFAK